jgi:two-component system sensor histidine kinase MtrB
VNRRWWRGSDWGLRTRLLAAFALVTLVTAVVVAAGVYQLAREAILKKAQDTAVVGLTDRLELLYPLLKFPPDQSELDRIGNVLSNRSDTGVVTYQGHSSNPGLLDSIPQGLRGAVKEQRVVWQRASLNGAPVLVIGTELLVTQSSGPATSTGVEVYLVHSLEAEQQTIDNLAVRATLIGAAALVFAVLLALLAARGVLRPVRDLGQAARRLGEGDLTIRLRVRGTDELSAVAGTFNDTAAALERYVGELRRMEADARRFVADVSHELRTPLAAMAAVTDVLDEEAAGMPGDAGKAARQVSQETHNLTRMVNDLIEISRFDSGAAGLVLDDIDVAAAVNASLRARGWLDSVEAELPSVLARLDPRRFDVIVANLVGNALRHGAAPISVLLHAEPDWIVLMVSDRGPGLDPQVLAHVFDRFYKGDMSRSRSEGSGLGLAIAWENARLHQGTLVAANRTGGGAVFTLRLPQQVNLPADHGDVR